MATEIPVDLFLDLLRQSGLVVDSQMLALMAEFSGGGKRPENSRVLADELIKRGVLTEWQADNLLQGKYRGFRLGPYRILRQLGQGGMSKVFLGEHVLMHRRCAIKVLPTKYQEDPDLLSRFHLEARAIAALDHPHIVRAYDFNKDVKDARSGKEIHYLVMEYVEGLDLRRMVEEQGPLDYRKAADFISQAAEGLAHAHSVGLVHRDVKPANLLVDPNGVLKILDLGLARVTFEGEEAWQTAEGEQSAVGTADYVAPEQVVDSRSVDGRADIYSLGYTFYYLLTGRRPFPKSTLVELLMAHRVESPEPISKFRPDVPPELVHIIECMTAKTPELRLQTANEVVEKLQAWLHESESGREYSRISALMAAAMRAKEGGGSEAAPTKPELVENAELELAFIDEEPKTPPQAKAPARHATESGKSTPAEVRGDKPRALRPGESGKTAALSRAKAEMLLDLMPGQEERIQTIASPQYKRHEGAGDALKLPWLWIGLATVVLILILLVLVITFGLPSKEEPSQLSEQDHTTKSEGGSAIPDQPPGAAISSDSTELLTKESAAKDAKTKGSTDQPKAKPKAPQKKKPKPKPKPKPTTETKPEPTDIAQQPSPAIEPTPEVPANIEPPPEATTKPVPPSTQVSPEPKIVKVSPAQLFDSLLGGTSTITLQITSSDSSNALLNKVIEYHAREAIARLNIDVVANSPNVLEIKIKASTVNSLVAVTLAAELKGTTPDGKNVVAWKQDKQVMHSVHQDPSAIRRMVRPGTIDFFKQFSDEVRRARSKVNPK